VARLAAVAVALSLAAVTLAASGYDLATRGALPAPPLGPDGHLVTTDGLTTHYEQWGRTGLPVVLVHGFLESAWVWHDVGPALASRGYRVYAIDVRGYGYTQRKGPYTLASDTEQLRTFLTAMNLDAAHQATPVLVGHSSGAAIVGNLARLDPAAVAAVAFMDGDGTPYGVGPGWVHRLFVDPYATALIRVITRHPSLAARAYRGGCSDRCPPFDAAGWLRPMRVAGAETALKAILTQPLIGMTYRQERQIHVPAVVIYGTKDPEMTAADARATADRVHARRVLPLPDAPHLGMLAEPSATVAAIASVRP
jgi:pimeloyl-ACP methyl ester carboxylesterase